MRTLLIITLLGISLGGAAQSSLFSSNIKSYANWSIENQEAIWQYVFPSKAKDKAALKKALLLFLKQNQFIQNITDKDFEIAADISKLKIDYKKFGGSTRYTSQAFINGLWSGKLTVEVVDGSYEVIVTQMTFDVEHKGLNAGNGINGTNGRGSWTASALNKDKKSFKDGRKVDIDLFNKALLDMFDLKK